MADHSQALAAGQLAKGNGFTVYIFSNSSRMLTHLMVHPLTSGVFLQGGAAGAAAMLRDGYKGPILNLPDAKEAMLEMLGRELRQLYRNQLKIQDASVLRILRNLNSFINGKTTLLFATGSEQALHLAQDYVNLFSPKPGVSTLDMKETDELQEDDWLITKNLFKLSVEAQQQWAMRFAEVDRPHLILEASRLDELDQRYDQGLLNEFLYEQLSLQARDVTALETHSFEELCVQPPEISEPRIILDQEDSPALPEPPAPAAPAAKKGLGGLLKTWWK
ncbi:MAG: hypothetical protein SFY80_04580 [Verrucomicrobiota bacterium]|nr:hypothetical protein [Verrucomicrobiota bacterium]